MKFAFIVIGGVYFGDAKLSADEVMRVLQSCRNAMGRDVRLATVQLERDLSNQWSIVDVEVLSGGATDIGEISSVKTIRSLHLSRIGSLHTPRTGIEKILTMPHLRGLNCSAEELNQIPDNSVASLTLSGERASCHAVIQQLRSFKALRTLRVNCPVDDASTSDISATVTLHELMLSDCDEITDASLASLSSLHGLQTLRLPNAHWLTPRGLTELESLKELHELSIDYATEEDIDVLIRIPMLERLSASFREDGINLRGLTTIVSLEIPKASGRTIRVFVPPNMEHIACDYRYLPILPRDRQAVLERAEISCDPSPNRKDNAEYLAWLYTSSALREVTLRFPADQDLIAIGKLERLRVLNLPPCGDTYGDEGLLALARLQRLERLESSSGFISDAGLSVLGNFPELRFLHLNATRASASGLEHVWKCRKLRSLHLEVDATIAQDLDAILPSLRSLKELEDLAIPGRVTDDGLSSLLALVQLRHLDLRESDGYTDRGLAHLLDAMPRLRTVDLTLFGGASEGQKTTPATPANFFGE